MSIPFSHDLNCFVSMPFGALFNRYYQNIFVPAIQAAGLRPVRADDIFSSTSIMSDIWRNVRNASVVLADLTGKNSNVFYELGLAHASKKPVVIITSSLEDVPFDLQGLRLIQYDKDDETWGAVLAAKITDSLKVALQNPGAAIPTTFLANVIEPNFSTDPLQLQLRQILDEIRALRTSTASRRPPEDEARGFMSLLDRHSNLLHSATELTKLEVFEALLRGDLGSAIDVVQRALDLPRVEAEQVATNISDWMKLYRTTS